MQEFSVTNHATSDHDALFYSSLGKNVQSFEIEKIMIRVGSPDLSRADVLLAVSQIETRLETLNRIVTYSVD